MLYISALPPPDAGNVAIAACACNGLTDALYKTWPESGGPSNGKRFTLAVWFSLDSLTMPSGFRSLMVEDGTNFGIIVDSSGAISVWGAVVTDALVSAGTKYFLMV